MFLATLSATLAFAAVPFHDCAAAADAVAIQYHFAGASDLAANTNFDRSKKIFNFPPARHFVDLVLDRLAGMYATALQFGPGADSAAQLRPILSDLLQAESTGSFGGNDKTRMDFVLAARVDEKTAVAWQKHIETALHSSGEPLSAEGFSGHMWNRPDNHPLWMLRARDWIVAGRGNDLLPIRTEYLQNIKQDNRPRPVMKDTWLSAEVDWPLLATWMPLSRSPLKLARTIVDVTASGGRMRATAYVTYPEEVPWQTEPWRIPKDLVGSPLSSFTASRDLAAFLSPSDALSRLSSQPLTNQLFCWALREMPLESFAAWPAKDAGNAMRRLGQGAPAVLNPILASSKTRLNWTPQDDRLTWMGLPLTAPVLASAHDNSGDFLEAKLFPLEGKVGKVSDELWSQFEQRDDIVYYDWELTGLRLLEWRVLSELLPGFQQAATVDATRRPKPGQNAKPPPPPSATPTPLAITEGWLDELGTPVLGNTVTEVARTSPTELTIVRNSQFLFTGMELVLLSHWLADAPMGPLDYSLLPRAKVSGPGLPPAH